MIVVVLWHYQKEVIFMNKTVKITLLIISVLMILTNSACGMKQTEGFSSDSLCVVYNGVTYGVGQKADKLVRALGSPVNTISQTSCHYGENGDEHTYEYYFGSGSFGSVSDGDYTDFRRYADVLRVHTVPLKPGADYICDIDCYTAEVSTDKGITVGSSKDDVIKAYGDKYTDEGEGFLRYYDGEPMPDTPSLLFYMPNGKVEFFSVSAAINF